MSCRLRCRGRPRARFAAWYVVHRGGQAADAIELVLKRPDLGVQGQHLLTQGQQLLVVSPVPRDVLGTGVAHLDATEALRERQDELDGLNAFMTSVLGSMNLGVAVVDTDVRVLVWNHRAADLWGVRSDEAVGANLFNLDIGLPLEPLRQEIRNQLTDERPEPVSVVLDAISRRGKPLQVRVTLSHIVNQHEGSRAALLVMDVVDGNKTDQG